jgi:prolyl oligopeptidase
MTPPIEYPQTATDGTEDVLHGRRIADPYRWLEDPDAAATRDWVRRQNEFSESYLAGLESRDWFLRTMREVVHRPRAGVPAEKSGWYFVARNDGTQPQDVVYAARSLDELLAGGRVIVDPNQLSEDGTDSVGGFSVSGDGRYLCYAINEAGSDWITFRLVELETGAELDERVSEAKFELATWLPDSSSFLYLQFPGSGRAEGTETAGLAGGRLMLHRVGTPQADDELVLHFPENDRLTPWIVLSHDDRYLVAHIVEGTEQNGRLWLYPVTTEAGRSTLGEPVKLIDEPEDEVRFVRVDGDRLVLFTDRDAPRGRLVSCDLAAYRRTGEVTFTDLVAERDATLLDATGAGDGVLTVSLVDAQPEIELHRLDGSPSRRIGITGGAVVELNAKAGRDDAFVGMSTVTSPTTSYLIDVPAGIARALPELVPQRAGSAVVEPELTIERLTAASKDGTPVPYFRISRADLDHREPRPTLLWGYGGFKIPTVADYRAGWPAWLAAGGVLAIANLRGGGEYGSDWHDAGRLANKQNVFDDCIAVAEHLVKTGVTTPDRLALHGRSNGGLLVGAVMTQRPDLIAAALPGVGVLDMLRFHRFTIGSAWTSDFGSPEDPDQFADLLAYSPLHNVRPGTAYPATLVMTGDHDDRVVPLHSHKFTAALQRAQSGDAPVLTRIEVDTGHGFGKPLELVAAEWADLLAFAAHHTGLSVK